MDFIQGIFEAHLAELAKPLSRNKEHARIIGSSSIPRPIDEVTFVANLVRESQFDDFPSVPAQLSMGMQLSAQCTIGNPYPHFLSYKFCIWDNEMKFSWGRAFISHI